MAEVSLRIYVHENRRVHGRLAYEWLLEQAQQLGIHGGSAFRAIAGFGRHGVLHEEHFFELAGDLPVVVEFLVSEDDAARLLARAETAGLSAFYARLPVAVGVIGRDNTTSST